jgi:hypothetical protein
MWKKNCKLASALMEYVYIDFARKSPKTLKNMFKKPPLRGAFL